MIATNVGKATNEHPTSLLRLVMKLDALTCGAAGALSLVASLALDEDVLGIPATALGIIGVFLLVYAPLVWLIGSRPVINRSAAWAVVVANSVWVVLSLVTLVAGWFDLTSIGMAVVIAQAVAVLVIADSQVIGLRRG